MRWRVVVLSANGPPGGPSRACRSSGLLRAQEIATELFEPVPAMPVHGHVGMEAEALTKASSVAAAPMTTAAPAAATPS